jgi:protein-tyrosine kinase
MDHIQRAVERSADQDNDADTWRLDADRVVRFPAAAKARADVVPLSAGHLESTRIIGHDPTDPRTRSFDMLRTQVLQAMDMKHYQFVAVTSPSPGCGKTFTSINLALSMARQRERSVLLVDLDLQKPQIARYLGLSPRRGLMDALQGRLSVFDAITEVGIDASRLSVLPNNTSTPHSSEWMASSAMRMLLQEIKREFESMIVVLDMPPMLSGDEVLAALPQIDCVLLVAAAGLSTTAEIEECGRHLHSADLIRLVLNKVTDQTSAYKYG